MNVITSLLAWKKPDASNLQDYRLYVVIQVIVSFGLAVHTVFSLFFLSFQVFPLAVAHGLGFFIWVASLWANRKGLYSTAVMLVTIEVACHALLATYLLGWKSGFYIYITAAIPITFFNPSRRERIFLLMALCSAMGLCILIDAFEIASPILLSSSLLIKLKFVNIVLAFVAIGLSCNYFRHASLLTEKQIVELANTDELTGLVNRRKMLSVIQEQKAHLERYGGFMTFILIDVDKFKSINDVYGHACGDRVLQEFSRRIKQQLRVTDWVSRWGGEEFLILLTNTQISGAQVVAEKLRTAIASEPMHFKNQSFYVTATFGLSEYDPRLTMEQILMIADERLYAGKAAGRNQVVSGPPL